MRSRAIKRKECSTMVWRPRRAVGWEKTPFVLADRQEEGHVPTTKIPTVPLQPGNAGMVWTTAGEKAGVGFWGLGKEREKETLWSIRQRLATAWLKQGRQKLQLRRGAGENRFWVRWRGNTGGIDWLAVVWGWVAALAVTLAVLIGAALYVAFTPGSVFLLSTYLFLNKVFSPLLGGFLAGAKNRGNILLAGFLVGLGYGMAVVVFRLYGGLFSVFWVEALLSLLGSIGGGVAGAWLGTVLFSSSLPSKEADSAPAVLTKEVGIVKIHGNNGQ